MTLLDGKFALLGNGMPVPVTLHPRMKQTSGQLMERAVPRLVGL